MPRKKRVEQFDPRQVGFLMLTQRCVRRAFLCGIDPLTEIDYSYRKEMIRTRMESLASVFAIDVITYSILSNHFHMVIRNRPDVVDRWDDLQIATNWLRIYPGKRIDQDLGVPSKHDIETLASDLERIQVLRIRLSDPSWYMKALSEPIARRCNFETGTTGHFWEGRFCAQALLDELSILACSVYVDLNPIRAAMAQTLEGSFYTSAYDRIYSLRGATIPSAALNTPIPTQEEVSKTLQEESVENLKKIKAENRQGEGKRVPRDGWLSPVKLEALDGQKTYADPLVSSSGLRASDRGFLSFNVQEYLLLLDWTARQRGRADQASMPAEIAPLLDRLGIEPELWQDLVTNFPRYYGHAGVIGMPSSQRAEAERRGQKYYHGQKRVADLYQTDHRQRLAQAPPPGDSPQKGSS